MERTFVMIKPDGVERGLIGNVISRFESKGFKLIKAKLIQLDKELAGRHYVEHKDKPFFGGLVDFITSGPSFAMVWEAPNAVKNARALIGQTNPADAAPGTIRGDFALILDSNIIHGADSVESAERESQLYFQ